VHCSRIQVKMRLVKRQINNDGSGSVTLCPEEPEDMVLEHSPDITPYNKAHLRLIN